MAERGTFDAVVIQVGGETAGIVVRQERGFRFYAANPAYVALERRTFRRPRDAERAVRERVPLRRERPAPRPAAPWPPELPLGSLYVPH